ncbi:Ig-like domain-containing protein [Roseateles sp. P5_E11]
MQIDAISRCAGWRQTVASATWLGLALIMTACGGGGSAGSPPQPSPSATVQAVDDPYTLPAGVPADLTVLANDSITGGTATVSVATNPAHGKVTVQGTTLRYTPDDGFYGTDQFTYRADVGPATSTATVKLTVETELELSGSLKPVPTTPTDVTAQVGDGQFKASADANGTYVVKIKSSRVNAFITLTSQSTGAQARVALASAVGDFGTLLARRSAHIDETQWPSLRLDALTTGRYGLLLQMGMPTSSAGLRASLRGQDPTDLFNLVMLIRHIVEENGDLPGGAATTLDLMRSTTALASAKYLSTSGSQIFLAPTVEAFAAAQPPTVGPQGMRLVVDALTLDLTADGKGTVQSFRYGDTPTAVPAHWTQDGDVLRITLDGQRPPPGGSTWHKEYRVRQIRGADDQPSALLMMDIDNDPNCSVFGPACVPRPTGWSPVTSFDLERDRLPLRAEDFAASQRWAGLLAEGEVTFGAALDVPGFSVQLVDGQLLLRAGTLTRRYTRLRQDADGLEYWRLEVEQNGQRVGASVNPVVKSGSVALSAAQATRRWFVTSAQQRDPVHWLGQEQWWQADGKVSWIGHYNGQPYASANWALSSDGREITMLSSDGYIYRYRPVAAVPGGYLALYSSSASGNGTMSLVRLSDLGPIN